MTKLLLPIHIAAVGIWLGCVLTEALFERALLGKGRDKELLLAGLHKRVDLMVEIPAFVVVLVTGLLMLRSAAPSALLHSKIGFGLLAIATNAYCVWLVYRRLAHARAGNWSAFEQIDRTQHKIGAVVLVCIVVALALGIYLHANA
jgi:hypothetical protein